MNFKNAFRYQNHLEHLLYEAEETLRDPSKTRGFTIKRDIVHQKNKVDKDSSDEYLVSVKTVFENTEIEPNNVLDFICDVIAEKEKLYFAISKAKASAPIDIDSAMASNKIKHDVIKELENLYSIKASESKTQGKGYKFNNDGVQSPYIYDIVTTYTINFDRNKVKGIIKRLKKECDENSERIDSVNISNLVDFEPSYDVGDSLEDSVLSFMHRA